MSFSKKRMQFFIENSRNFASNIWRNLLFVSFQPVLDTWHISIYEESIFYSSKILDNFFKILDENTEYNNNKCTLHKKLFVFIGQIERFDSFGRPIRFLSIAPSFTNRRTIIHSDGFFLRDISFCFAARKSKYIKRYYTFSLHGPLAVAVSIPVGPPPIVTHPNDSV